MSVGLAWAQKVEATDYQKLFTNSLVLVFILPKFASIGIFCGTKSVMTVFIPEYRQRLATLPRTVDFIYHYFEKVTAYL